jgi:hypothetical protein
LLGAEELDQGDIAAAAVLVVIALLFLVNLLGVGLPQKLQLS